MKIKIIAVGKIKQSPQQSIIDEYLKQLPGKIIIKEIEVARNVTSTQLMKLEADKIISEIPKNTHLVIMDSRGKNYSSEEFTKALFDLPCITFIIGGAFGFAPEIMAKADLLLSFGKMTWPHKFARVMLVEQIYRGYSIKNNHPYHK